MKVIRFIIVCCLIAGNNLMAWSFWGSSKNNPDAILKDKFITMQRKQIDDPTNPYNNYNLGVTCYKQKSLDAAANNFEHAINNAPDKPEFKKRAHYNLAYTNYRRAESVLGTSWDRSEVKDEVLDNALSLTDQSMRQADAVLVLDGEHKAAKKLRENAETLQKKILMKKYQQKQDKDKDSKDQQSKDQKNQDGKDQQGSSCDQKEDGKDGQQGEQKDGKKSDGKDGASASDGSQQEKKDAGKEGDDKDEKGSKESEGLKKKDDGSQEGKNSQGDEKQHGKDQAQQQKDGNDVAKEEQKLGEKKESKPGNENEKEKDGSKEGAGLGEKGEGGDAGPEQEGAMASQSQREDGQSQLSPHVRAMLDSVDQIDAQNQQRAMARDRAQMNRGGVGRGQKPW